MNIAEEIADEATAAIFDQVPVLEALRGWERDLAIETIRAIIGKSAMVIMDDERWHANL